MCSQAFIESKPENEMQSWKCGSLTVIQLANMSLMKMKLLDTNFFGGNKI